MYKKECKWCKKEITVKVQPLFASHVATCDKNPNFEKRKRKMSKMFKGKLKSKRITKTRNCLRCGNEFKITATEAAFKRDLKNPKLKKYCSDKCSRQRTLSKETKDKIRKSLLENGNMFVVPNELRGNRKGVKNKKRNQNIEKYKFTCLKCGKVGYNKRYNKNQKYHMECWLSISGGIKKGSSRGKSGWYKGYWCDSSYELAFVIYCLEHNIKIQRNKKGFEYEYKGKKKLFYPDFIVEGKYTEIKNYKSELTNSKLKYFPYEIDIYYKKEMQKYLNYVKEKYGKNFIDLYEK